MIALWGKQIIANVRGGGGAWAGQLAGTKGGRPQWQEYCLNPFFPNWKNLAVVHRNWGNVFVGSQRPCKLFIFIYYLFIYVNILKLLLQSSSHCNNQTLDGSVCEYNGPFSLDYNGLLLQALNSILVCV